MKFNGICQLQMRQKQRDMSDGYEETTRPLSDGSAYDDGSTIVTMREKHRVQVCFLYCRQHHLYSFYYPIK